ncbi:MAG: hypothetical protein JWO36_2502 [Myxococcales bacterium]|nr:hypothetical protein [Myxococcales bacterium]
MVRAMLRESIVFDYSLPIFQLKDAEDRDWGTDRLWQRQDMLAAILHDADCTTCNAVEHALRAEQPAWEEQHVGLVLVHVPSTPSDDEISRNVLEVLKHLGATAPCLVIADRYGRIAAVLNVHAMELDQIMREAREWMDFVQEQCDECGVPVEWENSGPG